jgi:serine/threonine-protein kinase
MTGPLASDHPPSSEPDRPLRPGDLIAGKYKIERILGKGGVGVVVAARDTQLQRKVAVKFLRTRGMSFPGAKERFLREAQAAVAIHSEHVARVIEFGTLDTGAPFIVMEYLTGIDLGDMLERSGPMPIAQAVDFVLQAGEAIAEAHSLGIIHRDLKPPNLFLAERPDGTSTVKVLDFGLSTAPWSVGEGKVDSLTSTDMVAGSPHFMSPEQVRSLKHVDVHTDIWALGVILYQLVSDALPFDAEAVTGVIAKILTDPPMPLAARRPDVPAGLEAVILKCLEKPVERRTSSVAELALALERFGSPACRASVETIVRLQSPARSSTLSGASSVSIASMPAAGPVSASAAALTLGDPAHVLGATERTMDAVPARSAVETLVGPGPHLEPAALTTPSDAAKPPGERRTDEPAVVEPRAPARARLLVAVMALVVGGGAALFVAARGGPRANPEDPARPLPPTAAPAGSAAPVTTAPPSPPGAASAAVVVTPGPSVAPSASAPPEASASAAKPTPPAPVKGAVAPAPTARPTAAPRPPRGKDDPLDHWQ